MIRIGNAQGFWGDRITAAEQLVRQQPDIDYITLDFLAEVSMSILAIQREKDPEMGYAADFVEIIRSLIPHWKKGSKVKVIANAGGLNPQGCAKRCAEVLMSEGCPPLRIGIVSGDNILSMIQAKPDDPLFRNMDTTEPLSKGAKFLVTANAYFGAKPIVEALQQGADIVITGRVADPSLTVAPCVAHYGWSWDDYDKIAGATIAGHLIECGTQVTGGISTNWLDLSNPANIGYPIAEVLEDGSCILTKPKNTGGSVCEETVKEQLLYEIGDPNNYLSPDVTVSFLSLQLKDEGSDRVRITGAKGRPPPSTYKVSGTYKDGFKMEAMLAVFGRDAFRKAWLSGKIAIEHVREQGFELEHVNIECLGSGDVVPGVFEEFCNGDAKECVLRIAVADHRKEALECLSKEIAPLVTCGPQGVTGYTSGRPKPRPIFGYWPCLIEAKRLKPVIEIIQVGSS